LVVKNPTYCICSFYTERRKSQREVYKVLHVKMLGRRGVGGQVDPMGFFEILSSIMLIGKDFMNCKT
jgi:hypothetical protein